MNLHLVRPKSSAGWRVVPLVPWMVDALRTWRKIAPANKHGLVWPAADGRPRIPSADTAAWKVLQDEAGVRHESGRYYFGHEARHATATLLLEAGVETEVIKTILGHSSIVTSQGYMHVNRQQAREAISRVAERLKLQAGA